MLTPSLQKQLDDILSSHRTRTSGAPLAAGSKVGYATSFLEFVEAVQALEPQRQLAAMADFRYDDLTAYQRYLEQYKTDTGALLKPGTITQAMMCLKAIFKAAYRAKLMPENIVAELKPKWHPAEQGRRLSPEEIEKLCRVDEVALKGMSEWSQFLCLRNSAMVSIHKDAALRAGEVIRLCVEDILWGRRTSGGHVPIQIRESKDRLAGTGASHLPSFRRVAL